MILLDSFAFIAFLEGEPGELRVTEVLEEAQHGEEIVATSLINLGEVLYITERKKGIVGVQEVLAGIQKLPIQLLEVDARQVFQAAHIKANYPVSYADAFAIAIAREQSATVLTGDKKFRSVEKIIQVEFLS